jgi:hypothetical protein
VYVLWPHSPVVKYGVLLDICLRRTLFFIDGELGLGRRGAGLIIKNTYRSLITRDKNDRYHIYRQGIRGHFRDRLEHLGMDLTKVAESDLTCGDKACDRNS